MYLWLWGPDREIANGDYEHRFPVRLVQGLVPSKDRQFVLRRVSCFDVVLARRKGYHMWLRELMNKINEASPKSIKDINDLYDYKDEHPQGKKDSIFVACGQCNEYNELQYIYDEKLEPHISKGIIKKDEAIKALSECCAELKNPRNREDFYRKLSQKLLVMIK